MNAVSAAAATKAQPVHAFVREAPIRPVLQVITGSGRTSLPDSDVALAKALARGDRRVMEGFIAKTLPRITAIAVRMLADRNEAEDVAQETYLRVWRKAETWTPGAARFESWVMRIAINLCYDRLRKRRELALPEDFDRADGAAGIEDRLAGADGADMVRSAVQSLPDRQRLALELCHFQELSNIEAADIMEVSVEAVESLLSRARRTLREHLRADAQDLIETFEQSRGDPT